MKKIITVLSLALAASATLAQAEEPKPISKALEELFDDANTQRKMPAEQPLYLKIIKSKTLERSTLIYRCRHVGAKSITDSVESATSPSGTVEISDEQNMITINDVNDQIDEIKDIILALDNRGPQVLVEAQIVEVQMGDTDQWDAGVNFSYYDSNKGTTSSIGGAVGERRGFSDHNGDPTKDSTQDGNYANGSGGWFDLLPVNKELSNGDIVKLNTKLSWLKNNNKAEILSSPNLLVDLGATASVSTGTDQPLLNVSINNGVSQESVYYKRTGVNLRVTPELINDDTVTLQVRPEVTSVVRYENLSQTSTAPVISVRNIDTKLNVDNGGVVMMGGLFSSKDIETEEKIPFFCDIPYIGKLFKSIYKEEVEIQLVFLLKVSIVSDNTDSLLANLDNSKREVKGVAEALEDSIAPEPTVEEE